MVERSNHRLVLEQACHVKHRAHRMAHPLLRQKTDVQCCALHTIPTRVFVIRLCKWRVQIHAFSRTCPKWREVCVMEKQCILTCFHMGGHAWHKQCRLLVDGGKTRNLIIVCGWGGKMQHEHICRNWFHCFLESTTQSQSEHDGIFVVFVKCFFCFLLLCLLFRAKQSETLPRDYNYHQRPIGNIVDFRQCHLNY